MNNLIKITVIVSVRDTDLSSRDEVRIYIRQKVGKHNTYSQPQLYILSIVPLLCPYDEFKRINK